MTTAMQAQSNARNAQFSTGPRSVTGKAQSARNALQHGYCAADIVMPNEDRAAFDVLLADIRRSWGVIGRDQEELADEIAAALWRRWRLRRTEAELWSQRCGQEADDARSLGEALANDCDSDSNAIEKLRRWWVGNERHLNRCQERLALMKRLERKPVRGNVDVHRAESQARSREIDGVLHGPVPWLGPDVEKDRPEISDSVKPTQSTLPLPDQGPAAVSTASEIPVSRNPPTFAQARTRRERRALERAQRRAERRQKESA